MNEVKAISEGDKVRIIISGGKTTPSELRRLILSVFDLAISRGASSARLTIANKRVLSRNGLITIKRSEMFPGNKKVHLTDEADRLLRLLDGSIDARCAQNLCYEAFVVFSRE